MGFHPSAKKRVGSGLPWRCRCLGIEQKRGRAAGPTRVLRVSPGFLLSLSAQKGLANPMGRNRAAAVNHRAFRSVPVKNPGALASCLLQPPDSWESCPPPFPLSGPEQSKLCVKAGTAPSGVPEQTQTQAPGTARSHSLRFI